MQQLLNHVVFRDAARARATIQKLSAILTPEVQKRLRYLLAASPDPDQVMLCLERLYEAHPEAFSRLTRNSAGLQYLVAVFGYSAFLSEAVLQSPEWLEELAESRGMERVLAAEEFEDLLEAELAAASSGARLAFALAVFRRRQLLRIVLRDVLNLATLPEITEELSNLAAAILEVSYRRLRVELERRYGVPYYVDGEGRQCVCSFSVMALGKLGGQELNYSSDIDLMFLYSANGETSGGHPISNKEFFQKLAHQYTELLSSYTPLGACYRVDLRLRPDGRLGEICLSLEGATRYYQTRARDWELQMLIKARPVAGDLALGRALLDTVEPRIYSTTLDFGAVESVSATRERIHEQAARRRAPSGFDVKLARGGIRDIEFLVQCLQRLHGGREPWVRHGGTLLALARLRDKKLLADAEYAKLASAYQFLRTLEHRLQFDEDRQTHTLPAEPAELETLARRMPAAEIGKASSAETLLSALNAHLEAVQVIYERVIHAQRPVYYMTPAQGMEPPPEVLLEEPDDYAEHAQSNLVRFLDRKAPRLAAMISRGDLRRGLNLFEHFLEKIVNQPQWIEGLERDSILAGYLFDIFDHSQYFSEQLIRSPELLAELRGMREGSPRDLPYAEMVSPLVEPANLRRFFRREMFRIQAESICLRTPIFDTLERTSELADATLQAAYRMAVSEVLSSRPPSSASYKPTGQLMVIALGRLGMYEFDLASDADLVFVLPDEDVPELAFWTRVAAPMINRITAYTGEGVIFAVDTRLRPDGREGALVQTVESYRDYFARRAEAWEGITYMKSRAVAGDVERGTAFLNDLQKVDWRRYGQSGRSRKELLQMRLRLEKELSAGNPLKAGRGSYYDIDFALMYLRLRGAGICYKVLNTPARIDVIEQMGHLERADADFLRDASTFYRAVDHGIRVSTGQAAGELPRSESQLEVLRELVSRWTPDYLHDQPLALELAQVQQRTREFFDRVFGSGG